MVCEQLFFNYEPKQNDVPGLDKYKRFFWLNVFILSYFSPAINKANPVCFELFY